VLNDLNLVKSQLNKNKADLADLNNKLKNSWYRNSKLKKLTESLQRQIQEKEESVANLTSQVAALNGKVDNLNGQVAELNDTVQSLSAENQLKGKLLNEKTDRLHTAYYVTGTTKELRDQHVISATGGLLGIGRTNKLNDQIDPSKFTAIDITKTTTIPVNGRKINMVTAHPADSYKIEQKDNEVEAITITNPEEFWKASRYLVVAER
jgi:polyhydroxyalkanoate synthesis regulator phasin